MTCQPLPLRNHVSQHSLSKFEQTKQSDFDHQLAEWECPPGFSEAPDCGCYAITAERVLQVRNTILPLNAVDTGLVDATLT